jgi:hypothetical protein
VKQFQNEIWHVLSEGSPYPKYLPHDPRPGKIPGKHKGGLPVALKLPNFIETRFEVLVSVCKWFPRDKTGRRKGPGIDVKKIPRE